MVARRAPVTDADEALRRSERRLRELYDGVDAIIASLDDDGSVTYNARLRDLLGHEPSALTGERDWEALVHPLDQARCDRLWRSDATSWELEYRVRHADGSYRWIRDRGRRERQLGSGRLASLFVVLTDITALKEAEEAARANEAIYRALVERSDALAWATGPDIMASTYISPQVERILGYPAERWREPGFWLTLVHPDDRERVQALTERREESVEDEYRVIAADGRTVWFMERIRTLRDETGAVTGQIGVSFDITERKAVEERLREAEALYRGLIERQDAVTWVSDSADGPNSYMSPQIERILGYPAERWREPGFWQTTLHPDDRERVLAAVREPRETLDLDYRAIAADGRTVWFRERIRVLRDPAGREVRYGVALDVTALRDAEAERIESDRRLRELVDGVDAAIGYSGEVGKVVISGRIREILGYEPEEISDFAAWGRLVHPDDIEACRAVWDGQETVWTMQYRMRHADGRWVWVRDRARRTLTPDGRPDRIYFVITDATAAVHAEEEALALERRTAELAKLEALARVAATTAHDFGNVLLGIDIFAAYLEQNERLDERGRDDAAQIRQAVRSGRAATAALVSLGNLSDSELIPVDLHALLGTMTPALLGIVGPTISLRLHLDAPDARVEVDPAAFERAIINLVVNARDALPGGGSVSISTSVVEEDESTPTAAGIAAAGRYLSVEVRDDGIGMELMTLRKAFEPYFTTKPIGKGTGLGLSSVHAVAHAVDGHVHAESAPGEGAVFRVCFPLS